MGGLEEVDESAFHLPLVDWVGESGGCGRVDSEVELDAWYKSETIVYF